MQWHNLKYSRIGHLLQNRFRSEAIKDDIYLLTVLRYIHQNPSKAGLVQDASHYKWSSYIHYIEGSEQGLVSIDIRKSFFHSQDKFKEFMKMTSDARCLDYEVNIKYTDQKLKIEILKIYKKPESIAFLPIQERDCVIKEIKQCTGASNRQISRVLGIGRGIVERIKLV